MAGVRATIVGSLPKPVAMAEPERLFAAWRLGGEALERAQDEAVRHWLQVQEAAGLDIVTDGEQRRRHYIWGFLDGLTGIDTETLGRKPARGQRYQAETAVARIVGDVAWTGSVLAEAAQFAKRHTQRPLKVTLPGPMTIADSVLDTVGGRSPADLAMMFADLLNREAKALVAAGADVVQFDEPCFNIYLDALRDWGMAALERAMAGVEGKIAVHICYGYGVPLVKQWKTENRDWSHYGISLPLLAKSRVDQVSIETAASGVDVGVIEALAGKEVLFGVVSCSTNTVETPELVAERLRRALAYVAPEQLIGCTDCGMVPLPLDIAEAKLRALGEGVRRLNAGLA
jgi:5-methyltetrahydropteroyltriglutamate--homocysteine methyltransferase